MSSSLTEAWSARKDIRTGYWVVYQDDYPVITAMDKLYGTKAEAIKRAKARLARGAFYVLPHSGGTGRYRRQDAVGKGHKTFNAADKAQMKLGDDYVVRFLEEGMTAKLDELLDDIRESTVRDDAMKSMPTFTKQYLLKVIRNQASLLRELEVSVNSVPNDTDGLFFPVATALLIVSHEFLGPSLPVLSWLKKGDRSMAMKVANKFMQKMKKTHAKYF